MTPYLVVLSSPSGAGKSTIARHLLSARADLAYSVSATTRPIRNGETDGASYYFLSRGEFEKRRDAGEFLEWAEYGGTLYGTLRSEIDGHLAAGQNVVLDLEVNGARQLRARYPDAVHIFILPPSGGVLVERLRARNTEDADAVRRRLQHASDELGEVTRYDYVVVNDDLVGAVDRVAAILDAEGGRVSRQSGLTAMVERLRREVAAQMERVGA